jgi:hypothetical protein
VHIARGPIQFAQLATADIPAAALGEGRMVWDSTLNIFVVDDGRVLAKIPLVQMLRRTAGQSVTSSVDPVDDNTLQFTVGATEIWAVTMSLHYTGHSSGDLKLGWDLPSGATFAFTAIHGLDADGTDGQNTTKWTSSTVVFGTQTGGVALEAAILFGVIIVSSTAGTAKLQFAQGTSNGAATTMEAGSLLKAERIG